MKLSDKKSIQELTLAMYALGLKNVVIAPGSRNAPLIVSFNQHPQIHCTSIRDERSAGFFAIGMALELNEPVALLCTSGSAALNLAPAIVEAYYQRIPLIVITADRPVEWIGQGDGQTINQNNIYHNYIRKSYQLYGDAANEEELWCNRRCISEGFAIATVTNRGPVHFNVPLKEPLFNLEEIVDKTPAVFKAVPVETQLESKGLKELQDIFTASQKVILLVGQNTPDEALNKLLLQLAQFENVVILCETTSNVHDSVFVENIDRCITAIPPTRMELYMPDLLITVGGAIVSKKIKNLLRVVKPAHHWNIDPYDSFTDTYCALSKPIPLKATIFLKQFLQNLSAPAQAGFKQEWNQLSALSEEKHSLFMQRATYSDLTVFNQIFNQIPEGSHVHYANSSPIRYAQLFCCPQISSVHSNRGTSGIDGCTSTAMGAASTRPGQPYILITGDIAFFYDNNAFWNNNKPGNLKIILINNGGGGIFRIINGPSETTELENYFETKHHTSAKKLIDFYGAEYLSANDEASLGIALKTFFKQDTKCMVLEIFTPNELNSQVLASYFKYLQS